MLKALLQPFQLLLNGATGKDRLEKKQLAQRLMRLETDYNRLQQDMDELLSYTDEETEKLNVNGQKLRSQLKQIRAENQELRERNEALESQIIFLNQKLEALKTHNNGQLKGIKGNSQKRARAKKIANQQRLRPSLENQEAIDLSNISLALVGGHETTHREVTEELKKYGLKRCVHVPPHSIASNGRNQIKDKIGNCDLIVTITSYVDHSVSRCVKQLKETSMLTGDVIRVSCRGKSGVVREVLEHFSA